MGAAVGPVHGLGIENMDQITLKELSVGTTIPMQRKVSSPFFLSPTWKDCTDFFI